MEYILTFENTHFAIKAEDTLLNNKIAVNVMPLPAQISAGCGIALRINSGDFKLVKSLLIINKVEVHGLFKKETIDGYNNYLELGE